MTSVIGVSLCEIQSTPAAISARTETTSRIVGPERGFYVRRLQTAELRLPVAVAPGDHDVALQVGLAGVTERTFDQSVRFE